MNAYHQTLCLLVFILTSTVLSMCCSPAEAEVVAGDDNYNVGAERDSAILAKFRLLLGLQSRLHPHNDLPSNSFSPAPAPVEEEEGEEDQTPASAPAPVPILHAHRRLPFHHALHNRPTGPELGEGGGKSNAHAVVIALLASVGSTFMAFAFAVTVFIICKRYRRKRTQYSSSSTNKVSYDPDPGAELFYLNSLAPILDIESSCKNSSQSKSKFSHESLSSFNASHKSESETIVSCTNVEKTVSDAASCLDEEMAELRIESSHSDDESFHSVGNVWEPNLSCHSGECSVCSSSNGSSPPRCNIITYFPSNGEHSSQRRTDNDCSGKRRAKVSFQLEIDPECEPKAKTATTSASSGHAPAPPPPPITMPSNSSTPRPPPPPITMASNGSTPMPLPPPPPLPPPGPPTSHNVGNSARPPPPPPINLQQAIPVGKDGTPLPKLKPLHWDKVRAAPDRSMVWDEIRSSSFELDEQMIESLFGYNAQNSNKSEESKGRGTSPGKHVLDNKRLQNITILLKALNASADGVCQALIQGRGLNSQQLEALAKMMPTKEEEDKLSNYKDDVEELGSAEIFVKAVLTVPFAFSRIQVMLYKETFEDEVVHLKKSFAMLEEACQELRSSRLFLRLLEAVLKTGNRMNVGTIRGGARAFKLDTLLKLADVKGTDGKTTLLHFVVLEIIRSEGLTAAEKSKKKDKPSTAEEIEESYRVMGLDIVSGLSAELCNVKKTASVDLDVLASSVSNLAEGMEQLKHLVDVNLSSDDQNGSLFVNSMKSFMVFAERTIEELKEDEDRVLVRVREITEYYHGDMCKEEGNPLRIFVIVRDFLGMLDRVCREVRSLKGCHAMNSAMAFR